MNIITLTANPAIDLHLAAKNMEMGSHNPARTLRTDSGGKGVNLSRALHAWGIDNLCYLFLGREGADEFLRPLRSLGMRLDCTLTEGRVRRNINIHTEQGETVIATDGPAVTEAEICQMEKDLLPLIDRNTLVALCGSISDSSDREAIIASLYRMKERGAGLVLDSRSLSLEEIIALRPYLIKPNAKEAEALSGIPVTDISSAKRVACAIRDMGCERVLLTLGSLGAVFADAYGCLAATVPAVTAVSTVGAGDSTVAGFIAGIYEGMDRAESFALAVAFGTASCLEEGSLPPDPCRIKELASQIVVKKV